MEGIEMSGGWQQQPGYPAPQQGWSLGKKLALAISAGLLLGGVVLGVMVLADSGNDDSDSEDVAADSDQTTTTTATTSTTVAPTTTTSTTVPAVSVVPPEGYTQAQADAYSADVKAAVPELPVDAHQPFLEISAIECRMVGLDPDFGPATMEATRTSHEGEYAEALELGGVDAVTAAELEERVIVAAADAAADHFCPEHAEHIRID